MNFPVQVVPWNEVQVETLKTMWADGISATKIAKVIGGLCTRSAVLGKVHRMRLAQRVKRGRHAPPSRAPKKDHRQHRDPPVPVLVPLVIETAILVSIEEIRDGMCRWPIGDPALADFRFCGCVPILGRPYCTAHAALAYAKPMAAVKLGADGEPVPARHYRSKMRTARSGHWL